MTASGSESSPHPDNNAAAVPPPTPPAETAIERAITDLPEQITHLGAEPTTPEHITDRGAIIGKDGRWLAGWALRFIILVVAGWILLKGLGIVWAGLFPVLLALIVCTVLWPPVRLLRTTLKFPPAAAVVTTMIGGAILVGGIIALISPSIANQFPQLISRSNEGFSKLLDWAQGEPLNLDVSQFEELLDNATSLLQQRSGQIASGVLSGISSVSSVVVTLAVMLVLTFFFLKDGPRFLPWMRAYTGGNAGWHLTELLSRCWNTLAGFIRAQALVSFVDAIFIGTGLLVLQVPLALALAIITFFAGFIPIVGAVSAGALAVIIALVTNGLTNAIFVLVLIIAVQQLEGNILSPIIQSKAMNLHAAIVLLAITVGSTLFGIVGAFLAVPVAAVAAVCARYHSELVALRAGEITIDEIQIATARSEAISAQEGFDAVRARLGALTKLRSGSDSSSESAQ